MESVNVPELIASLGSSDDSVRKMAAFKLQNNIGDPSFADTFISYGGLPKLRNLALNAIGNTLAYGLTSFSKLLELDHGWDMIDAQLTDRLVQFIVDQPLVNILRGALSILVAIVSHPLEDTSAPVLFGYRALRPAIEKYPTFLEMLVSRLSATDHVLCANALQLINSLLRDAITNEAESEWRGFVKKLQDLGVVSAACALMQTTGTQELAHPLLEFQTLMKMLMRKWKAIEVDWENKEHRRALKGVYQASNPTRRASKSRERNDLNGEPDSEKWRQLGFQTETPTEEFYDVGFLGMMDFTDFVIKNEDGFQRLLLEQATKSAEHRCPIAKASIAVTAIFYDHFEVDRTEEDHQRYVALESRQSFDKVFKPLLLQWSRLHTSGLQAFVRLWAATGAEEEDFDKIEELVRILVEHVVGLAPRSKDVSEIEQDLADYELSRLRDLQMELLELTHEDAWGHHLRQVKEELHHEALQFIKEQRIRCLLTGAWFPIPPDPNPASPTITGTPNLSQTPATTRWRFVRLSHNRRYLHYADFGHRTPPGAEPGLDALPQKIDLSIVSSVVSNVSASNDTDSNNSSTTTLSAPEQAGRAGKATLNLRGSKLTKHSSTADKTKHRTTNTKITIHGHLPSTPTPGTGTGGIQGKSRSGAGGARPGQSKSPNHTRNQSSLSSTAKVPTGIISKAQTPSSPNTRASTAVPPSPTTTKETPLLTLHPASHTLASEFLDGLLLLLNQAPITAETNKLVQFIARYGLRIRLLNVRFEEEIGAGGVAGIGGVGAAEREVVIPSRDGVDDEFFYDVGAGGV